jgi:EpsI family protein
MSVYLSEQFIELPHITLEVADSCSGENHIIALVALAIPIALMTQKNSWRKATFIMLGFILGLLLNGLRVALIGIWTKFTNGNFHHGPFDVFYLSFILFFGLVLLIIIGLITREKSIGYHCGSKETELKHLGNSPVARKSSKTAFFAAVIILAVTGILVHSYRIKPSELQRSLASFPKTIEHWQSTEIEDQNWPFKNLSGDEQIRRVYRNSENHEIGLFIGYYRKQEQDKELATVLLNWLYPNAVLETIKTDKESITINRTFDSLRNGGEIRYYFWYNLDGSVAINHYQVKLMTMINAIMKRKTNGAMIVIAAKKIPNYGETSSTDATEINFIKSFLPILDIYLKTQ